MHCTSTLARTAHNMEHGVLVPTGAGDELAAYSYLVCPIWDKDSRTENSFRQRTYCRRTSYKGFMSPQFSLTFVQCEMKAPIRQRNTRNCFTVVKSGSAYRWTLSRIIKTERQARQHALRTIAFVTSAQLLANVLCISWKNGSASQISDDRIVPIARRLVSKEHSERAVCLRQTLSTNLVSGVRSRRLY